MDIYYENEFYEKIKTNDDEQLIFNNKSKKIKRDIKLKSKLIYKYFIKRMTLLRSLIILFVFIFILLCFFQNTINLIEHSEINIYKLLYNIAISNNLTNNIKNKTLYNNYTNINNNTDTLINNTNNKTNYNNQTNITYNTNNHINNNTNNYTVNNTNKQTDNHMKYEIKFDSIKDAYKKALPFIRNCLDGVLYSNNFSYSDNPKVSAVIPVYNSGHFINKAIKSIQNQNIFELEIILINDFSKDDTLSVLEKIQKEDSRIKIIKNKKNMGILYSRSIGALSAKGKYIFPLDNDDMFLDRDVFKTITNIADFENIDLLEFKAISVSNGTNLLNRKISDRAFMSHKLNVIMVQPELGDYPLSPGDKIGQLNFQDVYIWSKCIKTKIYQKTLNFLGKDKYTRFMIGHEDVVINFALFNTAESFKFIGKYGIFRIYRKGSANKATDALNQNLKNLFLADIVISYLKKSNERIKLVYYLIYNVLNLKLLRNILNQNEYNRKVFKSCFDKFFNCNYIPEKYKNEIRKKGKQLKFINYNF